MTMNDYLKRVGKLALRADKDNYDRQKYLRVGENYCMALLQQPGLDEQTKTELYISLTIITI